jgi:hypothetical protein
MLVLSAVVFPPKMMTFLSPAMVYEVPSHVVSLCGDLDAAITFGI